MQVIQGPTVVADKFGPGLNGFKGSIPPLPPPTQLTPEWFDSVQQEIVNVILGQGIVLDGLQFDQLKQAIDDYSFVDPHVTNTLTVDSGAMILVQNLGTIEMLSGSGLVLRNGSTFAVEANVTLICADNTWVWGSSDSNDWTINGNVTLGTSDVTQINLIGDVDIGFDASSTGFIRGAYVLDGASSIVGGAGSLVGAESIAQTVGRWVDSGATLPSANGYSRWNGTFWSFRANNGQVRTFDEPVRGYDPLHATALAGADTAASATRRIKNNEPIWVEFGSRVSVNQVNRDVYYQLRVTGPLGTADIIDDSIGSGPLADKGNSLSDGTYWTPTDTWPAEAAEQSYVFLVRIGVEGPATVTARRVMVKVSSAIQI